MMFAGDTVKENTFDFVYAGHVANARRFILDDQTNREPTRSRVSMLFSFITIVFSFIELGFLVRMMMTTMVTCMIVVMTMITILLFCFRIRPCLETVCEESGQVRRSDEARKSTYRRRGRKGVGSSAHPTGGTSWSALVSRSWKKSNRERYLLPLSPFVVVEQSLVERPND